MAGPIVDYSALQSQLDLSPLIQAGQLRQQKRNIEADNQRQDKVAQLARDKFAVDQQEHAAYLTDVEAYKSDPTPARLRDIGLKYPEQAEALKKAGDSYTSSQKQDLVGAGFGALGALAAGNTDLAASTLEKRITALKNSGIDTSHTQAAVDMIKAGKSKEATAYLSYAMAGLVGSDHAASVMETLGVGGKADDRRADNERQDRKIELDERRVSNSERATNAAISRGNAASARADRKAAGGGKGGKKGAFSDSQLDALIQ